MQKGGPIARPASNGDQLQGLAIVFAGRIANGVARLAGLILYLAEVLLEVPSDLLRSIAGDLADSFLHGTLDFVLQAFLAILVHDLNLHMPASLQVTRSYARHLSLA
jgi:hypothetical protein